MNIVENFDFKKDSILATSSSRKSMLVENFSKQEGLQSVKIMTFQEMAKSLFFDYDEKALFYLVHEKGLKIDFAKELLESMYDIEDATYEEEKLQYLASLKQELLEKKLFTIKPKVESYLKRKTIYYYDEVLTDLGKKVINKLEKLTTLIPLSEKREKNKPMIYELDTKENEIRFVIHKMISLYKKDVPFSKMHILNATSEYDFVLPRLLSFYHIPYQKEERPKLYGTRCAHFFLKRLKQNKELSSILAEMEEESLTTYQKEILDVLNHYAWYQGEPSYLYDLIEYDFRNKSLPVATIKNGISIHKKMTVTKEDEYYFFLGFNQENVPTVHHDDAYLDDTLKQKLGLDSVLEKNRQEKEALLDFIFYTKNLTITYKKKDFYPSSLIKEYGLDVSEVDFDFDTIYSDIDHKLIYANLLDEYVKFGTQGKNFMKYHNQYPDLPYCTYQNQYTMISKEELYDFLNQELKLSYSRLDDYYKCRFRYYIGNILRLDAYEETFERRIGNIFHDVLSHAFTKDFDFEECYQNACLDLVENKMESFFLTKLKEDLKFIIEVIKEQQNNSALNQALYEKRIVVNKDRNIKVTFIGVADKILYQEKDGMVYAMIIDYKTGSPDAKLKNVKYGLEMQLPTYLYLVKKSGLFPNVTFVGFYLQKILEENIGFKSGKTYIDQRKESLKYVGYSSDDEALIEKIDVDYADSKIIRGMKKTSKGLAHYSKVMSKEEMDQLVEFVDDKIEEGITDILEARFDINPKIIAKNNVGCEFCKFKDICYRTPKDFVYFNEEEDSTLLGGEEDA